MSDAAAVRARPKMKLLAPEVVQTSAMDCGPASLTCLVEGFGIPVSYGRLREACQTDVDGTSIDTIEDAAGKLGLDAEQIMVPTDHLLLPEARALPALVVVRLPSGFTHFVVVWRRHGPWLQVMDPSTGRRWPKAERFLGEVFVHEHVVPAAAWREWAATPDFQEALSRRLREIGAPVDLMEAASADAGWKPLGELDAATRMVSSLVESGALRRGGEAARAVTALQQAERGKVSSIPDSCWSIRFSHRDDDGAEHLFLRGAVAVRVKGRRQERLPPQALTPELEAALREPPARPWRELARLVSHDGILAPLRLLCLAALLAAGTVVEALVLRGMVDLGQRLSLPEQRLGALGIALGLFLLLLLLEIPLAIDSRGLGRRLECRLRMAFLGKLPRLPDRYFASRPTSDMANRSHAVHQLRHVPEIGTRMARAVLGLLFTFAGIAWLDPRSAPLAALVALLSMVIPLVLGRSLAERDLRVRSHAGALSRFYLDALLGLVAVRAHGAERAVRREHESLLTQWGLASVAYLRAAVAIEGLQAASGLFLAGALLWDYLGRAGDGGGALLFVYWALLLPALGQELAQLARQVPAYRNVTLRLLEPLGAPEESPISTRVAPRADRSRAVSIRLEDVTVSAAGHEILRNVTTTIAAGAHVAIVGPSGAGKTSLFGLLLGWHRAAAGRVEVDGVALDAEAREILRAECAWVDPTVQIWNRTLLENLAYGTTSSDGASVARTIDAADVRPLLASLPLGLQTSLGEGGGLVSGGEGQRVRFGRSLSRDRARLVLLDEPFRGLEAGKRRELLGRARALFQEATLLCITHDVSETLAFDRVLVMEGGRLVEDGRPADLAAAPSRYQQILQSEEGIWDGVDWRRLHMHEGRVVAEGSGA